MGTNIRMRSFIQIVESAQEGVRVVHAGGVLFIGMVNGEYAGKLTLSTNEELFGPGERCAEFAEVVPHFRGRGVATALYDAAEAYLATHGEMLVPSPHQTDGAKAFWAARRK